MKKQLFLTLTLLTGAGSANISAADGGWGEMTGTLAKLGGAAVLTGWASNMSTRENNSPGSIHTMESYAFLTGTGLITAACTNNPVENATRVGVASGIMGTAYYLTNTPFATSLLGSTNITKALFVNPTVTSLVGDRRESREVHGWRPFARGVASYFIIRAAAIYLSNGDVTKYLL